MSRRPDPGPFREPQSDKHPQHVYAPGLKTGYGAKTLPGIREAIEDRRWQDAEKFSAIVAKSLDSYGDALEKVAKSLGAASRAPAKQPSRSAR
ncbi:MAG: hypothetical protein K1X78_15220 [Verrucomicrobiaceae bacterium]|nr:hypothetical protein [Verrucomicrobiaceae bacterium]